MHVVMFYHSLVSDWNHGNAHFLRGVATELQLRGHSVRVLEPSDSWSRKNLEHEHGNQAIIDFQRAYPSLTAERYRVETLDLDRTLDEADLVLVHEWNDHLLVELLGAHRVRTEGYRLLFHDTHHRSVSERDSMAAYRLEHYDGVLAFGEVIRQRYLDEGWADRVWTWHEAADIRVFSPQTGEPEGDVVWVGNWGDEERTAELQEFLVGPVRALALKARVYGVRYPPEGQRTLAEAGIEYAGWLPNYRVPEVYGCFRLTLHIPRRPYIQTLPGIPTIRVFEALACGIPLISAPWEDVEQLFSPGSDYLVAKNGKEMREHMAALLAEPVAASQMAERGLKAILARHTCGHRVDDLLRIVEGLGASRQQLTAGGAS